MHIQSLQKQDAYINPDLQFWT